MEKLEKLLLALTVFCLIILAISKAPKGSNYIQYEKTMLESNQMNINDSEYFIKVNGVLKLNK